MVQHLHLMRFRVQESPTQLQNHPLIVIAINENKCRTVEWEWVKSHREYLAYFSVLNQMSWKLQPKASCIGVLQEKKWGSLSPYGWLSDVRWFNLDVNLNQSDGNGSVCRISIDTAAKKSAGLLEAPPWFKSECWHFPIVGHSRAKIDWDCVFKF